MSEAMRYHEAVRAMKMRREQEKFLLPNRARTRKRFHMYRWCADYAIAKHAANGYRPVTTKFGDVVRDNELVLMVRWNTCAELRQMVKTWFVNLFRKEEIE